jgi:hypothetical protein
MAVLFKEVCVIEEWLAVSSSHALYYKIPYALFAKIDIFQK